MTHSRIMWGCVALVALVAALAAWTSSPSFLLLLVPCVLMLGAMLFMMGSMRRPAGRGDRR